MTCPFALLPAACAMIHGALGTQGTHDRDECLRAAYAANVTQIGDMKIATLVATPRRVVEDGITIEGPAAPE